MTFTIYFLLFLGIVLAKDSFIVHKHTPLLWSSKLSDRVGGDVHLKMDAMQPGSSFKIRGIGNLCSHFVRNQGVTHLVSSSCANAGMAVAVAGRALGVKATIVVSDVDKDCILLDRYRLLGCDIVFHGTEWNDADSYARKLGSMENSAYIEMFDHPLIFDGHASMIRELYADRQGKAPDCIVLSVGGGGLLSGVCTGLKQVGWEHVPIYACQSERCNLLDVALTNGTPTPTHIYSAEGHDLGTRAIAQQALDFSREMNVQSLLIPDREALGSVAEFLDDEHVVVEPLCAVALAALYHQPKLFQKYKSIVVIVCGGNLCSLDDVVAWRHQAKKSD